MYSQKKKLLTMLECAIMVALAIVLDYLPLPKWPNGGSLSIVAVPILYISYRHGIRWGVITGLINGCIQLLTGWYAPPAGTAAAVFGCVLLDYLLAFTVLGLGDCIARLFGRYRIVGYGAGAVFVNLLRFGCSFLSGCLLWGSNAPEGMPVWFFSLTYNAGYMIPNAILCGVIMVLLCSVVDPHTLHPMKKGRN